MTAAATIADRLTEAQRKYLRALEPNLIDADRAEWQRKAQREFQDRTFRKSMQGWSARIAQALVRKGVVAAQPCPCDCGYHYCSLTPLGLEVRALLAGGDQ